MRGATLKKTSLRFRIYAVSALGLVLSLLAGAAFVLANHRPTHVETLTVDSWDPDGTTSTALLEEGITYRVVSKGTYQFATTSGSGYVADAECARTPGEPLWSRERYLGTPTALINNYLDLLVSGAPVHWVPSVPGGLGCNQSMETLGLRHSSEHEYETYITPTTTRAYNFRILDQANEYANNTGSLIVEISRFTDTLRGMPIQAYVDTVAVDSSQARDFVTSDSLVAGKTYQFTATGSYYYVTSAGAIPNAGYRADAECSAGPNDLTFKRNRYADRDPDPNDDLLDLYLNGMPLHWASSPVADCEDYSNTYTHIYTPTQNGAASFRVNEKTAADQADNSGTLFVVVFEVDYAVPNPTVPPTPNPTVPPTPNPTVPPTPNPTVPPLPNPTPPPLPPTPSPTYSPGSKPLTLVDRFEVDSTAAAGVNSNVPLRGGNSYAIIVKGTWSYDSRIPGRSADAECARSEFDPTYQRGRYSTLGNGDQLDLSVDSRLVEWLPITPTPLGCDGSHTYQINWTQSGTRSINFRVIDSLYSDNAGTISVEIYEASSAVELRGSLSVSASSSSGTDTDFALVSGNAYLIVAKGTYSGWTTFDAECSYITGRFPYWSRYPGGGVLRALSDDNDLLIGGKNIEWVPANGSSDLDGCDSQNHTYQYLWVHQGPTSTLNFRIQSPQASSAGVLTVEVFRLGPLVSLESGAITTPHLL